MKSEVEMSTIFCFMQLYKEGVIYIVLVSIAIPVKALYKFVLSPGLLSAVLTQPSATNLCQAWQTKQTSSVSLKSKPICSKNGASSNCSPELVRFSLISGPSSLSTKGLKNLELQVVLHSAMNHPSC